MEFHCVESGRAGQPHRVQVVAFVRLDLLSPDSAGGRLRHRTSHGGRRHGFLPNGAGIIRTAAQMADLNRRLRAVAVDCLHRRLPCGQRVPIPEPRRALGFDAQLLRIGVLHDHQAGPALCPLLIVVDEPLCGGGPLVAEARPHGPHHDAVLQAHPADGKGLEQLLIFHLHVPYSPLLKSTWQ